MSRVKKKLTGEELEKKSRRVTNTEEFINKAMERQNGFYNYDKVEYVNTNTKVIITCPKHGDFKQTPASHLAGSGCPICSGSFDTRETFIEKAIAVHGYKYGYSKVVYLGSDEEVIITCLTHGDFMQKPKTHLAGSGCGECRKDKLREQFAHGKEVFIKKSIPLHGGIYGYDKVVYYNAETKVVIACPVHGDFEQTPGSHLQGKGCRGCGRLKAIESNTRTTEEFIELARIKHNNFYSYDKVVYIDSNTKVVITCPIHGDFEQTPASHLQGSRCKECAGNGRSNTDSFIEKALVVQNNNPNYDYSEVDYIDAKTNVTIICKLHGPFEQTPDTHLSGRGCSKCGRESAKLKTLKGDEDFILKSVEEHGDYYDYSEVVYDGAHNKVCIICPKHGRFMQTPHAHQQGSGCPICRSSRGERRIVEYLNSIDIDFIREYKIRGYPFRYDFYIEVDIFRILIEYDGEQHFKPIEKFGGMEELNRIRRYDRAKDILALDNGYELLRIKYTDYDRIAEIISEYIEWINIFVERARNSTSGCIVVNISEMNH